MTQSIAPVRVVSEVMYRGVINTPPQTCVISRLDIAGALASAQELTR